MKKYLFSLVAFSLIITPIFTQASIFSDLTQGITSLPQKFLSIFSRVPASQQLGSLLDSTGKQITMAVELKDAYGNPITAAKIGDKVKVFWRLSSLPADAEFTCWNNYVMQTVGDSVSGWNDRGYTDISSIKSIGGLPTSNEAGINVMIKPVKPNTTRANFSDPVGNQNGLRKFNIACGHPEAYVNPTDGEIMVLGSASLAISPNSTNLDLSIKEAVKVSGTNFNLTICNKGTTSVKDSRGSEVSVSVYTHTVSGVRSRLSTIRLTNTTDADSLSLRNGACKTVSANLSATQVPEFNANKEVSFVVSSSVADSNLSDNTYEYSENPKQVQVIGSLDDLRNLSPETRQAIVTAINNGDLKSKLSLPASSSDVLMGAISEVASDPQLSSSINDALLGYNNESKGAKEKGKPCWAVDTFIHVTKFVWNSSTFVLSTAWNDIVMGKDGCPIVTARVAKCLNAVVVSITPKGGVQFLAQCVVNSVADIAGTCGQNWVDKQPVVIILRNTASGCKTCATIKGKLKDSSDSGASSCKAD